MTRELIEYDDRGDKGQLFVYEYEAPDGTLVQDDELRPPSKYTLTASERALLRMDERPRRAP